MLTDIKKIPKYLKYNTFSDRKKIGKGYKLRLADPIARRVREFSGICLAYREKNTNSVVVLRNIVSNVGFRQTFVLNSPFIYGIMDRDVEHYQVKKAYKAKLYNIKGLKKRI